jgi:hypothetical protein
MPTLIELCGLEAPAGLEYDGFSLAPLLEGRQAPWESRAVVTDSQRVPHPVKWKDSAVMRGKWRLINGKELYDLRTDPGQRNDVAAQYSLLAGELRDEYERWWEKVSRQFGEEIPISIGSVHEPVARITSHDWRGDAGDCAWHQGQVREGKLCNSYVELLVETDGLYRFELRRWPEEEDRAMTQGIPGELKGWFSGGVALPIRSASLTIRDTKLTKPVADDDKHISFDIELEAGPAHLQTYLADADGNVRGAYYVYVSKLAT